MGTAQQPTQRLSNPLLLTALSPAVIALALFAPRSLEAHPMGNFSISHYARIEVSRDRVEIHYLLDMAEIPTFQEVQQAGITPKVGAPGLDSYLQRKAAALLDGLDLRVNGRPLPLQVESKHVIFPPGAGGLATMKMGFVYKASLSGFGDGGAGSSADLRLEYHDNNLPGRAGWKEIIAVPAPDVRLLSTTVPSSDRSQELSDYPADLLNSPPQVLDASLAFAIPSPNGGTSRPRSASWSHSRSIDQSGTSRRAAAVDRSLEGMRHEPISSNALKPLPSATPKLPVRNSPGTVEPVSRQLSLGVEDLKPNRQSTPRSRFTELIAEKHFSLWFLLTAGVIAAGLGALHALEPGHGKTIVAAYLVGSRGTAHHALLLGLVVTASHTAGVYLLGAVTLVASHYIVPERLQHLLGIVSGLIVTCLGFYLLLKRYAGDDVDHNHHHHFHLQDPAVASADASSGGPIRAPAGELGSDGNPQTHAQEVPHAFGNLHVKQDAPHSSGHHHHHAGPLDTHHGHHHHHPGYWGGHSHGSHGRSHAYGEDVSWRQLLALGITGGMVPCPAALVVLLSAVALNRVAFGLFLIVAFSVGLAAVLIAVGLTMVWAGRFVSRFRGEGPLLSRWLPVASAGVITLLGVGIILRELMASGILQLHI